MSLRTRLVLTVVALLLAGGATRLIQEAGRANCEPLTGRFAHLNCFTPALAMWPPVLVGLAATVLTWLITARVGRR